MQIYHSYSNCLVTIQVKLLNELLFQEMFIQFDPTTAVVIVSEMKNFVSKKVLVKLD